MINLGLTPTEQRALVRALASDHQVAINVGVLDRDHRHLGDLTTRVTEGQVNIDANADVTRQLQLTFVDDGRAVRVDNKDGTPALSRMVRVHYFVYVKEVIGDWVAIPIFTGPITKTSRDGAIVTLEAMGKEHIANSATWRSRVYAKGSNRANVARSILRDLTGETRFQFPTGWTSRTSRAITMRKESPGWHQAKATANSARGHLFYDGRGTARLRSRPTRTAFTFRDGNGGTVLSPPKTTDDSFEAVNTVKVIGAIPAGKKNPLTHTEYLPRSHPHSPWSMVRGGKNQYLPETIEDDTLRTQKAVDGTAKWRVREIEIDEQMVTFDALPMPLLEELDPFVVDTKDAKVTARLTQMSIPLGHAGVSTIGYIAPATRRRR